jgi:arylsulfatase
MRVRQSARLLRSGALGFAAVGALSGAPVMAQETEEPNIVVIWGDDIGQFNTSAYNIGMMG